MRSNCWDTLAQLAEKETEKVKREIVAANEQLRATESRLKNLNTIRGEYQVRLREMESSDHSIDNNLLYRKFIGQVSSLEERLFRDLLAAKAWVKNCQKKFFLAQREKAKYDILKEKYAKKTKTALIRREQKNLDDLAIIRHGQK
ncbi:MAG: flagellar export protein FliJ [Proteobacteria bacterium]|nr:flagellar export protein FliJ [Pseudomonadota bacterium]